MSLKEEAIFSLEPKSIRVIDPQIIQNPYINIQPIRKTIQIRTPKQSCDI